MSVSTGSSADFVLNRFDFHPGTEVTIPLHEDIREAAKDFAQAVMFNVPAGRHQSLALTAVQEAMMWANAGIAIDTKD